MFQIRSHLQKVFAIHSPPWMATFLDREGGTSWLFLQPVGPDAYWSLGHVARSSLLGALLSGSCSCKERSSSQLSPAGSMREDCWLRAHASWEAAKSPENKKIAGDASLPADDLAPEQRWHRHPSCWRLTEAHGHFAANTLKTERAHQMPAAAAWPLVPPQGCAARWAWFTGASNRGC